ncbi:3489_t:CDS:2 [Entrophospora sp. SA101]|nr:3489_t:CDS:2 [Entrophospora sp. SA101]
MGYALVEYELIKNQKKQLMELMEQNSLRYKRSFHQQEVELEVVEDVEGHQAHCHHQGDIKNYNSGNGEERSE